MPEIEVQCDDAEPEFNEKDAFVDLEHYRRLVHTYVDMRRYKTALFWAEKVSVLSKHHPSDVYWQAQCMFMLQEYHRAAHLIKHNQLEKKDVLCHYLIVECLLEAKEFSEAMELLNSVNVDLLVSQANQSSSFPEQSKLEIQASIWFLKGKLLDTMDNRAMAIDCYVLALQSSVYCAEALDALVQHEMLTAWEEHELMKRLPFDQQCSEADARLVKKLYQSKLKKYYDSDMTTNPEQTPTCKLNDLNVLSSVAGLSEKISSARTSETNVDRTTRLFTPIKQNILSPANKILQDLQSTPTYSIHASLSKTSYTSSFESSKVCETPRTKTLPTCKTAIPFSLVCERIQLSLDIKVAEAERYFYNSEYKKCIKLLDECLQEDPYHGTCLIIQIGCFVELKESSKLFYTAHNLVNLYPNQAISWYAVGCYYDLIGKSEPARRYLSKATTLDRWFGPGWLAYGHSFAKENEHDQAMAAYFKATQMMRGCHLPLLYIGAECGLTKNLELAEKFFYQAMSIAPHDVGVLHEIGVLKFELEEYDRAEEIFKSTLSIVIKIAEQNNESISQRWEPLLNNLAHCCRKNKKYNEALKYHQQALVLKPQSAATYTAIGFVHALMGKLEAAVDYLHRSLAMKRDDVVTSALLKNVIEDLMEEPLPDNITGTDEMPSISSIKSPEMKSLIIDETPPQTMKKLIYDDSNASEVDDDGSDMSLDM